MEVKEPAPLPYGEKSVLLLLMREAGAIKSMNYERS